MTTMTRRAATVEEAIEAALQTLGVSRDKVKVEVLHQGRKGFFGIGSKEAEVKITVIEIIEPTINNETNVENIEVNENLAEKAADTIQVVPESINNRTDLDAIL